MLGRKIKIYLDTSVVSYLQQDDSPEKTVATERFWSKLRQRDDVDVYMSDVTFAELNKCHEPKLSFMKQKVRELDFTLLKKDENAEKLAEQIIRLGILTEKSHDDCYHIAIAVLEECDYIVSWNFKHLVNIKTINGIRAISNLQGYGSIDIVSPEMMFQEDTDD